VMNYMMVGFILGRDTPYIPRSDSPAIAPATFNVVGVRFTDASEKHA
jgi:hypothetical protein